MDAEGGRVSSRVYVAARGRCLVAGMFGFCRFYDRPNNSGGRAASDPVGWQMRVVVRPAKREGESRTIFNGQLDGVDLARDAGKEVTISITADPLYRKSRYRDRSQFRYDIVLSALEVAALVGKIELSDGADTGLCLIRGAGTDL